MDFIRNYLESRKPLEIFFPPDEIDSWNNLKARYIKTGYYWLDFSIEPFLSKAKKLDKKNIKKYNKMKKNELKLRRSFRGNVNIIAIHPPPKPSNEERFEKLKKWSENNYYNITMITIYLYTIHKLKPCIDYEPDNLLEVYNRYSTIKQPSIPPPPPVITGVFRSESYENNMRRHSFAPQHIQPLPLPPSLPPSAPPCYKEDSEN